jgi:DNA primase
VHVQRSIGDDSVEQVRQATDIVELIGAYVDLRPAGKDFKACCPFHREKTPSFHVSPERQLFHCFGCGVGGDVFSFVMQHEGLTFPEALELLAGRAGITLPERRPSGTGPDRAQLIAALRAAVRFYRGRLKGASGARARGYLAGRGIPGDLLDSYYAGFAPPGGRVLLDAARKRFPAEILVQAGLVGQGDGGRLYDRFRDRIVIPILSVAGEPIGFGARALSPDVEPKYLNSPETPIYKKSQVLFGLPQARAAAREAGCCLVVEGYFDVLGLATGGIRHAIAPCGTAWTAGHVRLLLRYTRRFVFLFDGDPPGVKAAWRALESTLPLHSDVGIVMLPAGKDPDDMVRHGQLDELRALLASPLTPVAFATEALAQEGLDGHPRVVRIAELVARVGNAVAREMMVDEAAERARLRVAILRQEVERLRERDRRPAREEKTGVAPGGTIELTPLEERLLLLAQTQPTSASELREASQSVAGVRAGVRDLLAWVAECNAAGSPPGSADLVGRMRQSLGPGIQVGFLLQSAELQPDERFRSNLLRHLKKLSLEAELDALGYEIREAESRGAPQADLRRLLERKKTRAQELRRLRETASAEEM